MKKLILSIAALLIAVGTVGAGFAAFTDSASAISNVFQAGTLDLQLSKDGSTWLKTVSNTWVSPTNWAPGATFSATLWLRDAGTIDIQSLNWKMSSYNQSPNPAVDLGTQVNLTAATYDGNDILPSLKSVADTNNDGVLTLREMYDHFSGASTGFDLEPGASVLPASLTGGKQLQLTWQFNPAADNTYQGQSVTVSFDYNASN